jgi:anaerobic C4-dicarboxylate transporter
VKKADAAKGQELQNLKEIHAKELQDVKEQADKHTKELLDMKDKAVKYSQSVFLTAVVLLGIIAIAAIVGEIWLTHSAQTTDSVIAIGSAAVGGLAGLLSQPTLKLQAKLKCSEKPDCVYKVFNSRQTKTDFSYHTDAPGSC